MAFTVTKKWDLTRMMQVYTVISTADADNNLLIDHGLDDANDPSRPNWDCDCIILTPLSTFGVLAGWYVSGNSAGQFQVTKRTTAGSGSGGAQLQICAFLRPTQMQ